MRWLRKSKASEKNLSLEEKVMLVSIDKYAVLSTARFLSVLNAEGAIRNNDRFAYNQAFTMYDFMNRQIGNDTECAFVDERIPSDVFPEWPAPEMRVVFSDEEIDSWASVQVSGGSNIDDDVDVPF